MIVNILLYYFDLSLLFEVFRLNWNRKVITIVLFDLHNHANCHSLMCEGHLHYLMEERA